MALGINAASPIPDWAWCPTSHRALSGNNPPPLPSITASRDTLLQRYVVIVI